jgi:hypothetical protein
MNEDGIVEVYVMGRFVVIKTLGGCWAWGESTVRVSHFSPKKVMYNEYYRS